MALTNNNLETRLMSKVIPRSEILNELEAIGIKVLECESKSLSKLLYFIPNQNEENPLGIDFVEVSQYSGCRDSRMKITSMGEFSPTSNKLVENLSRKYVDSIGDHLQGLENDIGSPEEFVYRIETDYRAKLKNEAGTVFRVFKNEKARTLIELFNMYFEYERDDCHTGFDEGSIVHLILGAAHVLANSFGKRKEAVSKLQTTHEVFSNYLNTLLDRKTKRRMKKPFIETLTCAVTSVSEEIEVIERGYRRPLLYP